MMSKQFDFAALGSDIARSRRQYWHRRIAANVVGLLRLNRPSHLSTEIVQAINPVATIETKYGPMYCRTGHGRLLWRAETFFTEEPETIAWLDKLEPSDVLYDIGSNVGLYAVYAAKFRKCTVFAFEPEAQNYALLLENIALNDLNGRCLPANLALTRTSQMGRLRVRYITKGGAYNMFAAASRAAVARRPPKASRPRKNTPSTRGSISSCSAARSTIWSSSTAFRRRPISRSMSTASSPRSSPAPWRPLRRRESRAVF